MLQRLDIGRCNLTGQIPSELGKMRKLKYLHLIYNQLTGPIPSFIGNLSNLNFLDLGANQLTGPVPWTLGNLRSLEYLSISYNHLEGNLDFLASLGSCLHLNTLAISSNPFASGSLNPNHVGNLSRNFLLIEEDNSQIIGDLPSTLSNLSALCSISFANNQLSKGSPGQNP
jgi:Leucine-rich repeat (LRR) protein